MILFQLFGSIGVIVIYGIKQENWNPQGVLFVNSVAQIITMGGGAWLIIMSARQVPSEIFRLQPLMSRATLPVYVLILPLTFATQIFGSALASLWIHLLSLFPQLFETLKKIQDLLDSSMRQLAIADTPAQLVAGLISIAIVPAIFEELFFRGFAITNIERSGKTGLRPRTAIIVTAFAFGLSHLSPINFPAIVILGIVFGWLLIKTNDIRVTMLAHFLNNGVIVVALYLLGNNREISDALLSSEALPLIDSLVVAGISGIILFAILSYIGRLTNKVPA